VDLARSRLWGSVGGSAQRHHRRQCGGAKGLARGATQSHNRRQRTAAAPPAPMGTLWWTTANQACLSLFSYVLGVVVCFLEGGGVGGGGVGGAGGQGGEGGGEGGWGGKGRGGGRGGGGKEDKGGTEGKGRGGGGGEKGGGWKGGVGFFFFFFFFFFSIFFFSKNLFCKFSFFHKRDKPAPGCGRSLTTSRWRWRPARVVVGGEMCRMVRAVERALGNRTHGGRG